MTSMNTTSTLQTLNKQHRQVLVDLLCDNIVDIGTSFRDIENKKLREMILIRGIELKVSGQRTGSKKIVQKCESFRNKVQNN